MAIWLAIAAAISYGISDFAGGALSRKAHVLVVFLLSQLVSVALIGVALAVWAGPLSRAGIGWGLAAGAAGVAGTAMLYQGLAIGRMSVVAPITAVIGAGLPVLFGISTGERPRALAYLGIALGLIAVVIISRPPAETGRVCTRSLAYAFGAGAGFGLFYILLERSPANSGMWPLLGSRISMIVILAVLVFTLVKPRGLPLRGGLGWQLAGLGAVNTLADLFFLLASRSGMLSLVAVITSLYPAVTVGLAGIVLRERFSRGQLVGLLIAGASVALIAAN